jgi:hypothetical protein
VGGPPTIYDKLAAGNEGRVLAREVQAATSDFRGLAEPAERVSLDSSGASVRIAPQFGGNRRFDNTGMHGVASDVVGRELQGSCLRQ